MSTLDVRTRPTCRTAPRHPIPPALVALVALLLASVALGGCGFSADDPIAQAHPDPGGVVEPEPSQPPPTWVGREEVLANLSRAGAEGRLSIDIDTAPESCVALLGALGLVTDWAWQEATAHGGEVASGARRLLDQRLALVPAELHPEIEWYADQHVSLYSRFTDTVTAAGGTEAPEAAQVDASREYRGRAETLRIGMPDVMPMATAWSNRTCFGSR
jgi:hypothetical protein